MTEKFWCPAATEVETTLLLVQFTTEFATEFDNDAYRVSATELATEFEGR